MYWALSFAVKFFRPISHQVATSGTPPSFSQALHYYKNGEPLEDHQGMQAFIRRMGCYKHVLDMLQRLLDTAAASAAAAATAPALPKSPGKKERRWKN